MRCGVLRIHAFLHIGESGSETRDLNADFHNQKDFDVYSGSNIARSDCGGRFI